MPGPVQAIAYSPDGKTICAGSVGGEARLFNAEDKKRVATLKGHEGAIFAIAFHPTTNWVLTAGYEGTIRVFESSNGAELRRFVPVPLKSTPVRQQAAK